MALITSTRHGDQGVLAIVSRTFLAALLTLKASNILAQGKRT